MGLRSKPRFCFWNCGVRRSLSKKYEDTFSLIVLFSDEKYQKSSKDFPSLENLPASSRFALCKQSSPSGANIAGEPSHSSIATATGSKRPPRRLGFTAVPCWAMANLAVGVFAKISPSVSFADSSLSDGAMQKIPLFALSRQRRYQTHDAPSRRRQHTCFAYVLIPAAPLYAGVQTMRARICSAISCAMFARVVV